MRRFVICLALCAACATVATPVAAQTTRHSWFLNAGVGPSFGTFGATPVIDASAGYKLTDHLSLAAELGVLPQAPFEKARAVAPSLSPFVPGSDVHVNAYHANVNFLVQATPWRRLSPFASIGFGAFTGSTVARGTVGDSRLVQYDRATHPATNVGLGTTYRLTPWFGVTADYRHFIVNATDTQHVNRFATGVSLFLK
jgi:hypothetical protein